MTRSLILLAFCAALSCCATQPRKTAQETEMDKSMREMQAQMKDLKARAKGMDTAVKPLEMPEFCMGRAMHARLLLPDGAPTQAVREKAFKEYYESFLDAEGQGDYVACLRRQWSVPLLHAEYRKARRWLKTSEAERAQSEALVGADKRISDVKEEFAKKDDKTSLRRVTITFASGAKTTMEETFATSPEAGKQSSAELPDLKALDAHVKAAVKEVDAIDQPTDETPEQRRKRLGLTAQ